MSHEELERGEITETETSWDRGFREQSRYRERDRERTPRDDVYVSRGTYDRDDRYWERDRERERERDRPRDRYYGRRDDREWTRDTGRGRYYRDERVDRGYDRERDRDMDRDRYHGRDRVREQRSVYERPRHRDDWSREDRRHGDTYERKPEADTYRPDGGAEYRPRHRPSPEPVHRDERRRSKSRDDGTSRYYRRREDSIDSKRSGSRRGADDWDRPNRKRARSRSPEYDTRAQRRLRTNSPEPVRAASRRRSQSPVRRREEKRPERRSPPPREDRDDRRLRRPSTSPRPGPQVSHSRPANIDTSSKANLTIATASPQQRSAPSPSLASEKLVYPSVIRGPSAMTPTRVETMSARSPIKRLETPIDRPPSGPRSAVSSHPPPVRVPEIPEWKGMTYNHCFEALDRRSDARLALYINYARASVELCRAKVETDSTAIELRSAEQRRIFAEQQRQKALEA